MVAQELLAGVECLEVGNDDAAHVAAAGDFESMFGNLVGAERRGDRRNRRHGNVLAGQQRPCEAIGAFRFHRDNWQVCETVALHSLRDAGKQAAATDGQDDPIELST